VLDTVPKVVRGCHIAAILGEAGGLPRPVFTTGARCGDFWEWV
jgi:hypothetical protein